MGSKLRNKHRTRIDGRSMCGRLAPGHVLLTTNAAEVTCLACERSPQEPAAPPSTWLPTNDTHAPAPEPGPHVEPFVDDAVAFVDALCMHESDCYEPGEVVVGADLLCRKHASVPVKLHADGPVLGHVVRDPLGEAIAAAGEDPGVLAMQERVRARLFGGER